ncbi:hypothetical protein D1AOALGA4SA_10297 [Olavius algarvensis Delta 1 endosymbiont]|nr:hypothetical protein D1AOALGA4SA_10297 [Olavius algarvensis Delta 1 endosymbiont]
MHLRIRRVKKNEHRTSNAQHPTSNNDVAPLCDSIKDGSSKPINLLNLFYTKRFPPNLQSAIRNPQSKI